jgi:hypothetical protein
MSQALFKAAARQLRLAPGSLKPDQLVHGRRNFAAGNFETPLMAYVHTAYDVEECAFLRLLLLLDIFGSLLTWFSTLATIGDAEILWGCFRGFLEALLGFCLFESWIYSGQLHAPLSYSVPFSATWQACQM